MNVTEVANEEIFDIIDSKATTSDIIEMILFVLVNNDV
jgi:hypothetical protein